MHKFSGLCACIFLIFESGAQAQTLLGRNLDRQIPWEQNTKDISKDLQALKRNPMEFLSRRVDRGEGLNRPAPTSTQKWAYRCQCIQGYRRFWEKGIQGVARLTNQIHPLSGWDLHNRPEDFLGRAPEVRTLAEMDRRELRRVFLDETPWSGDFFAIERGGIGARQFDPEFVTKKSWRERYDYILNHPFFEIYHQKQPERLNDLAISEKYDLMVGDLSGALTRASWKQGADSANEKGEVEPWMGICHGWAPASFMVPRPKHAVTVASFEGEQSISLMPGEIKGLISQQWATTPFATRFLGQRCNVKDPRKDENGRIIEPGCDDINPATWHLVLINRLGLEKRSLIFDATYDLEVWNQPLYGYQYVYFNPETHQSYTSFKDAVIDLNAYKSDPFTKYRSPAAKKIVGVSMTVGYTIEVGLNRMPTDDPDMDSLTWSRYLYDLELSDDDEIIGGEWYSNRHPDFLWAPEDGARPRTQIDDLADEFIWEEGKPTPERWRDLAAPLAKFQVVLAPLVERLLDWSRR